MKYMYFHVHGLDPPNIGSANDIRVLIDGKVQEFCQDPQNTQVQLGEKEGGVYISSMGAESVFLTVHPEESHEEDPLTRQNCRG